ncbi:hypothetical protein PUN71_007490 [Arthrobacter sp. NQ7]|uniref:hypothetical protein n=1 Tax=Arthrobacter sp. NQ7 TaxID=3032303 RepID=UPI0024103749|nr:hypothetical protein [Arthrobacter sp. NQ7]MDJ0457037.1 hypothetical protein [Arthrobacter sp. NQ7]
MPPYEGPTRDFAVRLGTFAKPDTDSNRYLDRNSYADGHSHGDGDGHRGLGPVVGDRIRRTDGHGFVHRRPAAR